MNIIKSLTPLKPNNVRTLFASLNIVFNRVSKSRIKEVGPNRACAEWLMRNGALIKWRGQPAFVSHYNLLPLDPEDQGHYHIEEIDAKDASLTHHGFEHFYGCDWISTITFTNCWYIDDKCLQCLEILSKSLLCIEIHKCPEVTDVGLMHLTHLPNLRVLRLGELQSVSNLNEAITEIKMSLQNCDIQRLTSEDAQQ